MTRSEAVKHALMLRRWGERKEALDFIKTYKMYTGQWWTKKLIESRKGRPTIHINRLRDLIKP